MKTILDRVGPFALILSLSGAAYAQEQQPAPQPAPQPQAQPATPAQPAAPAQPAVPAQSAVPVQPAQPPPPVEQSVQVQPLPPQGAPAAGQEAAPPAAQWVYSYPTGQWVYTADNGWVWVPAGTSTTAMEGVPYSYLYTPAFGWTWYVSPWGWGPYHYGAWVRHPWRPVGWRGGWVAHPRVTVRLGGGGHYWHGRR
jgi:hypothetical protein